jgi:predicted dehydrogenase
MSHRIHRRRFLQTSAATGVGFWVAGGVAAQESKSPNEKIRFACIGIGGKGDSDSKDAANSGDVVGICDIDESRLNAAGSRFQNAEKFFDFRIMLEKLESKIDAVTVSTPDHTHAPAAAMAMRMGKHAFVQKPLSHSIFEARKLADLAREKKLVTQMGNQGTASNRLRRGAAILKSGALGTVSEVHVWTNRPIWPQGGERPAPSQPQAGVKWDLFLGPAPERPYANGYHPFAWRGWWDFGTGALGDMACHTLNMVFMGLDLRDPTAVSAEHSGHNKDSYPKWSIIKYEFPATSSRPALTMYWYDGGKRPPRDLIGQDPASSGSLVVGTKGKMYSPGDYGDDYRLLGDVEEPQVEIQQSAGHFTEWVNAIRGQGTSVSNIPDYSGPLTETVLLGNLAVWAGKRIDWDAKNLKATNAPDVQHIVQREYRKGWTL